MWIELWISGVENLRLSASEGTILAPKVSRCRRSADSLERQREGRAVGFGSIRVLATSGRPPSSMSCVPVYFRFRGSGGVPSSMAAKRPQAPSTFSVGPAVEGCALQGDALGLLSTCPQVEDLAWRGCPPGSRSPTVIEDGPMSSPRTPVGWFCPSASPSFDREVGTICEHRGEPGARSG